MDAVTYPHASVIARLSKLALFKVNMMERHPDYKEACAGSRVLWGPTFVVADGRGSEIRRWTGWLSPASFVAELDFCDAQWAYNYGKFPEAKAGFDRLVEHAKGTEIYPEALYWQGAAGFLAGGKDWPALRASWERLAAEYPGNRFGTHASVIEDAPDADE